jgi:hypothetical protein
VVLGRVDVTEKNTVWNKTSLQSIGVVHHYNNPSVFKLFLMYFLCEVFDAPFNGEKRAG